MRRATIVMLVCGGAALLALIAALAWVHAPMRRAVLTDAGRIRAPADTPLVRDVLWEPPTRLPASLNSDDHDYEPRLSWDGLTLYFVRGKPGDNADIWTATRGPDGWRDPEPLAIVNTAADELGPAPAPDGQAIYFYSDRDGGFGGYDLWAVRRIDGQWRPATNLGPRVNSAFNDYGPALTPDGKTLYFASNRPLADDEHAALPPAWPATVRETRLTRTYDIYRAALRAAGAGPAAPGAGPAAPVAELLTPHNEGAPCVSPGGDFLYFASDRPGGEGGFDLYRARRVGDALVQVANLGPPVNTPANELDPGLAQLGYALYFSSDRTALPSLDVPNARDAGARPAPAGSVQLPPAGSVQLPTAGSARPAPAQSARLEIAAARGSAEPADYDLYYAASREVYRETEWVHRPPINWAALLPWLLGLLAALLGLVLLAALLGAVRDRRLGLLARCLLASLSIHLLILLLLSFMKVREAMLAATDRPGAIHVTLAPPADTDALAAQVRGPLTQFDAPVPQPIQLEPLAAATVPPPPPRPVELSVARGAPPVEPLDVPDASHESRALPGADDPARVEPVIAATPPTLAIATPAPAAPVATPEPPRQPIAANASPLSRDPLKIAASQPAPPREIALEPKRAPMSPALDDVPLLAMPAAPDAPEPVEAAGRVAPPEAADLRARAPAAGLALPAMEESPRAAAPQQAAGSPRAPREATLGRPVLDMAGPSAAAPHVALAPGGARAELDRPAPLLGAKLHGSQWAAGDDFSAGEVPRPAVAIAGPIAIGAPPSLDVGLPSETLGAQPEGDPADERIAQVRAWAAQQEELRERGIVGVVYGRVSAAADGQPLGGAQVRLDLNDAISIVVQTDAEGEYALPAPQMPEHFALSAAHDGYLAESVNIPADALRGGALRRDFALAPADEMVIAMEAAPVVHHLGNDRWEGQINSQFQRSAEGRAVRFAFEVTVGQLAAAARARVVLLTKGVQCPHPVWVNGRRAPGGLPDSPADGSFGETSLAFPAAWLQAGLNTLELRTTRCMGDVDDFELVNARVRLD